MMSKKGFSLIEVLVTLSILGIMTGIATVSYQGYKLDITKRELKNSGMMFATVINTCVRSMGGWQPRQNIFPCKAETTEELKSKLNFTCPVGATCDVHTHGNTTADRYRYHCLSIQKEVSGKKLQVITRVSYDNPSNYQILCNKDESLTSFVPLVSASCKAGFGAGQGFGGLKDKDGIKLITNLKTVLAESCPWK